MQIRGIALASAISVLVVLAARAMFAGPTTEDLVEFHEQYPNKDACLTAGAERIAPCTSGNCYAMANMRMQQCLERAAGDKEQFCEKVTIWFEDSRGRDIFEYHCKPHTPYQSECEKLIGQVSQYCSRIIG